MRFVNIGVSMKIMCVVYAICVQMSRGCRLPNSNSGEFAELRGGDNEVRLWVVPHVARDKVRGSRKRGAEEHLVIGIGECLARICGHDFFAEQLYVHEEFIDTRWR